MKATKATQASVKAAPFTSTAALIELYRSRLKATGRSLKTISWYSEILLRYFAFLEKAKLLKSVNKLGKVELEKYILHLQQARKWSNRSPGKEYGKLSAFSIQGHVRAIKCFWGWLLEEGHIEKNPLTKFPLPRVPKNLISIMTVDHVKQLLKTLDKNTSLGIRNYLILILLLDTGLRIGELVNIKLSDIDTVQGSIRVTGKGQKQRFTFFSKYVRKELNKYLKNIRTTLCQVNSPYLFPEKDGGHLAINAIQQALRRIKQKAGLQDIKCHPHIFRHTFATSFISKGGGALALKDLLGHESLQTTQKYVHLQPEDLQKEHAKYTPLDDIFST
jgi:integrase/recombinase XerD